MTLNPPQNHALPKAKRYQETADISCNQGAHSILKLKVPPGFTNGVRTATNSTVDVFGTPPVDNNCSISGVSPYNLDNCNGG
ncbi:hypothetical protein ACKI2C_49655, partial [Streptomyces brasiliscabiei]|uniref:hypothetical protein n=1 Tax=Streptomyces brasiliscabiei TaxID=2736302 RepID=UPI0038F6B27F